MAVATPRFENPHNRSALQNIWDVVSISAGAMIGQLAVILAMPVLSRVFAPEDIGGYAFFASIVGVFATVVSLNFELAIPVARGNRAAQIVSVLAVGTAAIISVVIAFGLAAGGSRFLQSLGGAGVAPFLWLVPVCVFLQGVNSVLTYRAVRQRAFRATGMAKAALGFGQSVPQVVAGVGGAGVGGLIAGQLVAPAASIAVYLRGLQKSGVERRQLPNWRRLRVLAYRFRRFPMFTTWSTLINGISAHLPVVFLSAVFGPSVTGQFALAYRVLQAPLGLLGQALSQVFFGLLADERDAERIRRVTWSIFRFLWSFGAPTFGVAMVIAPDAFVVIFGGRWETSARFAQLLMPWLLISFVVIVLSILVSVLQRQAQELVYQIVFVLGTVGSLAVGALSGSSEVTVAILAGVSVLTQGAKIIWLLRMVGVTMRTAIIFVCKESLWTISLIGLLMASSAIIPRGIAVVLLGATALVLTHCYNYRFRTVYSIGEAKAA